MPDTEETKEHGTAEPVAAEKKIVHEPITFGRLDRCGTVEIGAYRHRINHLRRKAL
jgi:hypothetical protein